MKQDEINHQTLFLVHIHSFWNLNSLKVELFFNMINNFEKVKLDIVDKKHSNIWSHEEPQVILAAWENFEIWSNLSRNI